MSSPRTATLVLPPLRSYQRPMLFSTAQDDVTISAPQLGKTLTGLVWLMAAAWRSGESVDPWWILDPTFPQCRHSFRMFCAMAKSAGILQQATTTPPFWGKLKNGAVFEGRSWERPDGLYGTTIRGALVDEFGQLTDPAYSAISSRRAESVTRGEGMIRYVGNVGTIGGAAEDLWLKGEAGDAGFACRSWTWIDRALDHECRCDYGEPLTPELGTGFRHRKYCLRGIYVLFVEREASRMSSPQFRQLYGAEWADWNELPVYTFDKNIHVSADVKLSEHLPIELACDFNVDPMAWTIGQHHGAEVWTAMEQRIDGGATTKMACEKFISAFPDTSLHIHVFGDATGRREGTRSKKSDYQIIMNMLGDHYRRGDVAMQVPERNPPVVQRHNAVNAKLMAADGTVTYRVHPRCKGLIKDRSRVSYKPGTRDVLKRRGLTHFSDSDDYRIHRLFPIRSDSAKAFVPYHVHIPSANEQDFLGMVH